jgi:hypothetical protein
MTARRSPGWGRGTLAVVLVAASVLLAVVLVTWAASIGPSEVLRGDGIGKAAQPTGEPSGSATASPLAPPDQDEDQVGDGQGLLHVVAIILNLATLGVAVALVIWLVRWLRRLRRVRRARVARAAAVEQAAFDVLEPSEAVSRELLADAGSQRAALIGGTPRNAIVECWHRFELASAAAGVDRHTWETSSEHTLRVLNLVDAAPASVSVLARLYREARFSAHELTEADRARAIEALDEIHRSVGVRA